MGTWESSGREVYGKREKWGQKAAYLRGVGGGSYGEMAQYWDNILH